MSKILLIDQSETISKAMQILLTNSQHVFISVPMLSLAFTQLGEAVVHLVFMDEKLAAAQDFSELREVQQRFPQIPVVILQSSYQPMPRDEFKAFGINHFLKKPFQAKDFQVLLAQVLPQDPLQRMGASYQDLGSLGAKIKEEILAEINPMLQNMISEYCQRHFGEIAREAIELEILRLEELRATKETEF